jgi:hypothetical protein
VLVRHPGGHGVCRGSQDDLDAGLAQRVDDSIHPCIFEVTVGGLPEAPGGFAHADDADACQLHQGDILLQPAWLQIDWHVFVVISGSIEDGWL